jgi:hypothetical protein
MSKKDLSIKHEYRNARKLYNFIKTTMQYNFPKTIKTMVTIIIIIIY